MAAIYRKHFKSKISQVTDFQVWNQALSTHRVMAEKWSRKQAPGSRLRVWTTCKHSELGLSFQTLPRKIKTKKTKWTENKNKPLEIPHTSTSDQDSVVREAWKTNGHFSSALCTSSAQTEHFTPTSLILRELTPAFPISASCRDWSSQCTLPATWLQQNHSILQETLANKDLTLAQHPLVLPPHFQAHTEKALQGLFLSYQRNREFIAWVKKEPPSSCGCSAAQPALHALTNSSIQVVVTFLKFKQWAPQCKAAEGTTIHLWGCTQTFTVLSDVHWHNPGLLQWSHHFLGTNTYSFLPQLRA